MTAQARLRCELSWLQTSGACPLQPSLGTLCLHHMLCVLWSAAPAPPTAHPVVDRLAQLRVTCFIFEIVLMQRSLVARQLAANQGLILLAWSVQQGQAVNRSRRWQPSGWPPAVLGRLCHQLLEQLRQKIAAPAQAHNNSPQRLHHRLIADALAALLRAIRLHKCGSSQLPHMTEIQANHRW